MEPLFLALDQGTQSARAMLFDAAGNLVAKSQRHIDPYVSPQPGWAEQYERERAVLAQILEGLAQSFHQRDVEGVASPRTIQRGDGDAVGDLEQDQGFLIGHGCSPRMGDTARPAW